MFINPALFFTLYISIPTLNEISQNFLTLISIVFWGGGLGLETDFQIEPVLT